MSGDFFEAILIWEAGPDSAADAWLRENGLDTAPMRAGLLVRGSARAFARIFGVEPAKSSGAVELPIPDALKGRVASITIPPPRRLHTS